MMSTKYIFLGIFGIWVVSAAPSDTTQFENIKQVQISDDKSSYSILDEEKNKSDKPQSLREKRWFNYYGIGFPPISPVVYPTLPHNYNIADTGDQRLQNPYNQIYTRLQDIATVIRQTSLSPQPYQLPVFFPVIFVPQAGCACNPSSNIPADIQPPDNNNQTSPGVNNRFPEMEDPRQNWGFVLDENEDEDDDDDYSRPLSFEPIKPNRTLSRPPPPVDHGSTQADVNVNQSTQTTTTTKPEITLTNSGSTFSMSVDSPVTVPTYCDSAILSCCHLPQVTYDCFASQGCPDTTSYGNPCDADVILRVIDRFQKFYGNRNG